MSNHPSRRKPRNGQPIRFIIRYADNGQTVRIGGNPLYVKAYTAKAAKHQAKPMVKSPIVAEAAP